MQELTMTKTETSTVFGFIGIGDQGAPIARPMMDAGFPTWLWARHEASFEPFHDSAARYAATIEELAAHADHIGICVVNDGDVREVCARLFRRCGRVRALPSIPQSTQIPAVN
jgi:3-hydroxyisobutyrate dehydrogenase-like beta-hydroxyacid dehydrogenase